MIIKFKSLKSKIGLFRSLLSLILLILSVYIDDINIKMLKKVILNFCY